MLKIKKSRLPHLSAPHLPNIMAFSPMTRNDTEFTRSVAYAYADEHDNNWELSERTDTEALERFWTAVVEDVRTDPSWTTLGDID